MKTNQVKGWFLRRGETGVPGENLSVQSREPTNTESNPGHIGGGECSHHCAIPAPHTGIVRTRNTTFCHCVTVHSNKPARNEKSCTQLHQEILELSTKNFAFSKFLFVGATILVTTVGTIPVFAPSPITMLIFHGLRNQDPFIDR